MPLAVRAQLGSNAEENIGLKRTGTGQICEIEVPFHQMLRTRAAHGIHIQRSANLMPRVKWLLSFRFSFDAPTWVR